MRKKASRLTKLPHALEQVQLQLKDGCGCLAFQNEVEVEITIKRKSDGVYTGSTRGLFFVFPYETSRGWFKLVSRTSISLREEHK